VFPASVSALGFNGLENENDDLLSSSELSSESAGSHVVQAEKNYFLSFIDI
jgi:hypothetical protein